MTQSSALRRPSAQKELTEDRPVENLRILIVDDNFAVRRGLRSLLTNHNGFVVCGEASDGLEAIVKSIELRPDVIVMDVTMPNMDGLQATRAILKSLPHTRIVIISQYDPEIVQEQAMAAAAHGFVSKADLAQQLTETIESIARANRS